MTQIRPVWRPAGWFASILAAAALQACAGGQGPAGSGARVYAADVSGGAKRCEVAKIAPADGQTIDTAMTLANDGGWCGLPLHTPAAQPFDVGLLSSRPAHGVVMIHQVGDQTRIDYTPDRGFSGSDAFAVKLVPGNATVRISVTVTPPGAKA